MGSVMLFSDVDGTLRNRRGEFAVTAGALRPLRRWLRIVLTSSRTLPQLTQMQRALGLEEPLLAENGAVLAIPRPLGASDAGTTDILDERAWNVTLLGEPAPSLRSAVATIADAYSLRVEYGAAEQVTARRASVLMRPTPEHRGAGFASLCEALADQRITATWGGQWYTITRGADKGRGALELLGRLSRANASPAHVAGVGDAENDASLLRVVPHAFVIADEDGRWNPILSAIPGVRCMHAPGIAGWRDVIAHLATLAES
jgi:HAD superfamily hydrolase (TIGR01484 family)